MRISDWSSDVCSSDLVVAVRSLDAGDHALEVFVHSPDRDGLFAAIVISLDRLGVQIQQARALDGPGGAIFDSVQVLPRDTPPPPPVAAVKPLLPAPLAATPVRLHPSRHHPPRHPRAITTTPRNHTSAQA